MRERHKWVDNKRGKSVKAPNNYVRTITITDIERIEANKGFICLYPSHFFSVIEISPYVAIRMIQWLIQRQFLIIKGTLVLKIRNRKVYYNVSNEKETTQTKSGTSYSSPGENSRNPG